MNTTIKDITAGIDWHLLARQKAAAIELSASPVIAPAHKDMMDGLVNFLDRFQDTAAEKGLPVVFLHEDGFKDKDGNAVPEPPDDYWGENPDYPVSDWVFDASENGTRLGYWEWVKTKVEENS